MFDKSIPNEQLERMAAMPFVEYVKFVREQIGYIGVSAESKSLWEAREWVENVIRRYKKEYGLTEETYHERHLGNMFRLNDLDLDDWGNYAKTDAKKEALIRQFKSDMTDHLTQLLYDLEKKDE